MKIRTTNQLFEHNCQIKDMKLAGFSPSGLRYLCSVCGGQFVMRLDREKWEKAFGDNPSFRLTKKTLQILEEEGGEPVEDEESVSQTTHDMEEPDPQRFRWVPEEDDHDE
jgi:hypothetical protein